MLPEASNAVLRLHDTSGGASGYFDVPVSLPARNWYVHLRTPERAYYAELGLSEKDGGFISLARSNTIQTPRAWPMAAVPAAAPLEVPDSVSAPELPPPPSEGLKLPLLDEAPVGQPFRAAAALPRGAPPERRRQAERPAPLTPEPLVSELPAPSPRVPEPVDAAKILRARLEGIYASLERMSPPGVAPKSPAPVTTPPQPGDLTQLAEEHFSPGVSSKIPDPTD